ncbi:MAG TPA: twin-arginine translocase subunit TatC [Cyclobacteriaceae bacterium]|nr:twin-arginine translocase subunit TatC [Cyclobacteriaceae bacterium]
MAKEEKEMAFLDHLEELRWHLIRSLFAILVFTVGAFLAKRFIFHDVILAPSRPDFWTYRKFCEIGEYLNIKAMCIEELPFIIQSRQMSGQFTMHLTSSFVIGLILAFPYAFWELWRFISPGLYFKEKKVARWSLFYVSALFFSGILFGYYILTPVSINFLSNYQLDPSIRNEFDIISYISTITMLVLACGLVFQLPIVVYFLSSIGIVTPELMRTYRKHAIIVILLVAAIVTPPDVFTQTLVAIPLIALYEVSIFISKMVAKRDSEDLAARDK